MTKCRTSCLDGETVLLLQHEVPLDENRRLVDRASRRGCRILLNAAPAFPVPKDVLAALDVLIVNEIEIVQVAAHAGGGDEAPERLPEWLARRFGLTVAATYGEEGTVCHTGREAIHTPALAIRPSRHDGSRGHLLRRACGVPSRQATTFARPPASRRRPGRSPAPDPERKPPSPPGPRSSPPPRTFRTRRAELHRPRSRGGNVGLSTIAHSGHAARSVAVSRGHRRHRLRPHVRLGGRGAPSPGELAFEGQRALRLRSGRRPPGTMACGQSEAA